MRRKPGGARSLTVVVRQLLALLLLAGPLAAQEDVILRAMRDEIKRSTGLRLQNLEAPYYVEYGIHDSMMVGLTTTLGALVRDRHNRVRVPRIQVRVGSHQFDNSNYVLSDFSFGAGHQLGQMPVDNDYASLRRYLWLATDSAYKAALQAVARKRAALQHVTVTEDLADFAKTEPVRTLLAIERQEFDEDLWKDRLRKLSALFADYPEVIESELEVEAVQGAFYYVNSEGTEARVPEKLILLRVKAAAQASDGMGLRDAIVLHARNFDRLPPEAELEREVRRVAENLKALVEAPVGESYAGPVVFEGEAAAQIFAEVLGRNFAAGRRPVSEPRRPVPFVESELEGRIGSRVLPEWMDVVDDPTQREWRGRPLFGYYVVDLEGVPAKPVTLVEKGIFKDFLRTRQRVKGFEGTNGRARLPGRFGARGAAFGNLFVRASEVSSIDSMKKKMLELCARQNKPYGVIVRKMDFPSSVEVADFRRLATTLAQPGDPGRPVSLPLLVYRLYPDGKEELVRGLRFRGLSTRAFRDILAASDETHVFHFLENGAPFALMGAGGFVAESSVIAPSLLFEDLQLDRAEEQLPKPPLVPPPPLLTTSR